MRGVFLGLNFVMLSHGFVHINLLLMKMVCGSLLTTDADSTGVITSIPSSFFLFFSLFKKEK